MSILALDIATTTGWAFGAVGEVPQHGTFTCPSTGDDLGRFAYSYAQWLAGKIRELQPKEIVFESPILPRETNITTLKKLYGLAVVTEFIAISEGVTCQEITAGQWRKSFLGSQYPKGGTREELKRAVIDACRHMGWNPNSTDDADALGIWFVVACARNPKFEDQGPLFERNGGRAA